MDSAPRSTKRLNTLTLLNIYLRSLFSQGSFSVKYRQNIGFAFCMEPAGRKIWKNPADLRSFRLRHMEYFNGNPYMITLVLGAVANMEERLFDSDGISAEDISRFKTAVGQATGSVGDRFFWRTLRPFGLVLGLLLVMFYGLWGILVFLAVFNIPMLFLRWHWLNAGYKLGPKVVIEIKNQYIDRTSRIMESLGGLILAFLSIAFLSSRPGYGISWITAGTIGLFVLSIILFKRKIPQSVVFLLAGFAAVVSGIIISFAAY